MNPLSGKSKPLRSVRLSQEHRRYLDEVDYLPADLRGILRDERNPLDKIKRLWNYLTTFQNAFGMCSLSGLPWRGFDASYNLS